MERQLTLYDFEQFRELCHFFDRVHEGLVNLHEELQKPRALIKVDLSAYLNDDSILEIEIKEM